jgi:hypothetical protein
MDSRINSCLLRLVLVFLLVIEQQLSQSHTGLLLDSHAFKSNSTKVLEVYLVVWSLANSTVLVEGFELSVDSPSLLCFVELSTDDGQG